jgi:hypothetical protein
MQLCQGLLEFDWSNIHIQQDIFSDSQKDQG